MPLTIDQADRIAFIAHTACGQYRADKVTPYIAHPRNVAGWTDNCDNIEGALSEIQREIPLDKIGEQWGPKRWARYVQDGRDRVLPMYASLRRLVLTGHARSVAPLGFAIS